MMDVDQTKFSHIEEMAQADGRSAWLMSYADLVTLIMVFFILLFSLSNERVRRITDTLKSIPITTEEETTTTLLDLIDTGDFEGGKMLDRLTGMRQVNVYKEITALIRRKNLRGNMEATFVDGKIVLRIEGEALFNSGSAELQPEARRILSGIFQILKQNPQYRADIQGHTDNTPISTPKFESNWELSAIRATTVLRFLIENGVSAERLTATGFADLKPLTSNDTPEERMKNRRVEIVLKEKN